MNCAICGIDLNTVVLKFGFGEKRVCAKCVAYISDWLIDQYNAVHPRQIKKRTPHEVFYTRRPHKCKTKKEYLKRLGKIAKDAGFESPLEKKRRRK